jgi:hypothetical protein
VLSGAQAREQAKKVLGRVALGEDPQAERRDRRGKDQLNLRSVIEEYLQAKEVELRPRSFADIKRYLTGSYFRVLHALPVDTVTRKDIAGRLVAITRESSSNTAARSRDLLHAFSCGRYRWGMSSKTRCSARSNRRKRQGGHAF